MPSTLSGTVFNDLNLNGSRDPGEPGLSGWRVDLDYGTSGAQYVRTEANGAYSFTGVSAGSHVVLERLRQSIYAYTEQENGVRTVNLVDNETLDNVDFGNRLKDGAPTELEFRINTTTAGSQHLNGGNGPGRHSVATDAAGNFIVVWDGNGPGDDLGVFAQRYWADGTPRENEFRVNVTTAGNQGFSSVAMDAAGDFVVTWQGPNSARNGKDGYGDVRARLFKSDGTSRGEFLVKSNGFIHDVAMDAGGNFVVAYEVPGNSFREVLYTSPLNMNPLGVIPSTGGRSSSAYASCHTPAFVGEAFSALAGSESTPLG